MKCKKILLSLSSRTLRYSYVRSKNTTMYHIWEAEMSKANDSNNLLFAKGASTLLRPGLHSPRGGGDVWLCGGENFWSPWNKGGEHPLPEDEHDKLTSIYKMIEPWDYCVPVTNVINKLFSGHINMNNMQILQRRCDASATPFLLW